MQKMKKTVPIPKKMRMKEKIRMKTCCQNKWERLMINCLENTVTVKILAVFQTILIGQPVKNIKKK